VLRAEVIHQPLAFTGDPVLCLFRIGLIVGYDELDVPGKFLPRDRPEVRVRTNCRKAAIENSNILSATPSSNWCNRP
jgi:hypothetical protein